MLLVIGRLVPGFLAGALLAGLFASYFFGVFIAQMRETYDAN